MRCTLDAWYEVATTAALCLASVEFCPECSQIAWRWRRHGNKPRSHTEMWKAAYKSHVNRHFDYDPLMIAMRWRRHPSPHSTTTRRLYAVFVCSIEWYEVVIASLSALQVFNYDQHDFNLPVSEQDITPSWFRSMRSIRDVEGSATSTAAERVAVYTEEVLMQQSVSHKGCSPYLQYQRFGMQSVTSNIAVG